MRREYRSVLKNMNGEELSSTWYGFWNKDEEKMKQAEVAAANLTNEQLIK
ncbi:magnesium chelatase [Parageobacillus thermoglucosidasius]|nr:magnesium chelatase [Parageobacillus thermoglucosidasius]RDE21010.1 magnesium chelatase [Parageobacillus thermoglucosidasius]RDE28704.1 magnesium chelatase [Parageobacillus thermoglucosidasius]REK57598.1 MAG: magnesium chelatase [Geobacillus sp.]